MKYILLPFVAIALRFSATQASQQQQEQAAITAPRNMQTMNELVECAEADNGQSSECKTIIAEKIDECNADTQKSITLIPSNNIYVFEILGNNDDLLSSRNPGFTSRSYDTDQNHGTSWSRISGGSSLYYMVQNKGTKYATKPANNGGTLQLAPPNALTKVEVSWTDIRVKQITKFKRERGMDMMNDIVMRKFLEWTNLTNQDFEELSTTPQRSQRTGKWKTQNIVIAVVVSTVAAAALIFLIVRCTRKKQAQDGDNAGGSNDEAV